MARIASVVDRARRHAGSHVPVVTADLHLGHANIIEDSSRQFDDAEAMNRALMNRWNEVVVDDDEAWMLGDFAVGKIDETLPLVAQFRGRKVLLTGNHDDRWADHGRRAEGWAKLYREAGRRGAARPDQPRPAPVRRPRTRRQRTLPPTP